jgi:hypothetical protein
MNLNLPLPLLPFLPKDLEKIILSYKEDLDIIDQQQNRIREINFDDCLDEIVCNGIIEDIKNNDFGSRYMCGWIQVGDFGASFRHYFNYRLDRCGYEIRTSEWFDDNSENLHLTNNSGELIVNSDELNDIFERSCQTDWDEFYDEYECMNEILEERGTTDEDNVIRDYCIDNGYY